MRKIVLDTETTGLDPNTGHRLVEIACIEMIDDVCTKNIYHTYINPERDMPAEAFKVHGLSEDFLKNFPLFSEVADAFLEFIQNDPLIIHNASFDLKFLNYELDTLGKTTIDPKVAIDTLVMAREKFPGQQNNLDALCKRLKVDNSGRDLHGALIDTRLLADVYIELIGGKQRDLGFAKEKKNAKKAALLSTAQKTYRSPRPHSPSQEEEKAHQEMVGLLKNPVWKL